MKKRPVIAVTVGDPAGIGGEITAKAFCTNITYQAKPVILCDAGIFRHAADVCGIDMNLPVFKTVKELGEYLDADETTDPVVYSCGPLGEAAKAEYGKIVAEYGKAAYTYIATAVQLIDKGIADAMVTGPINKESLKAAEIPYIGHTEILGGLSGTDNPLTMFETLGMRVFFLSRHVSLRKACDLVTGQTVYTYIKTCLQSLEGLGDTSDKALAVAGLNPHCGEHGLFGTEDDTAVRPAVKRAQEEGYPVVGPIGADSVFHQAKIGRYRAVLSLYHDQGHIAAKTYDFERTVSVTLGMPFLRTSVDHGTAFDIAGTGNASEISMIEAFRVAEKYVPGFLKDSR